MLDALEARAATLTAAGRGARPMPRPAMAVLLLATLLAWVPLAPWMPAPGLDASWVLGINQAVAQGLVFGREMVFTFGPYAAIYTTGYHPATDPIALTAGALVAIAFALTLMQVRATGGWLPTLLLAAVLALLPLPRDVLLFIAPLALAVVCVQALPLSAAPGETVAGGTVTLTRWVLMAIPLGILPLVKGSALLVCAEAYALLALAMLSRPKALRALPVLAVPLVTMAIAWRAAGQPLDALPDYFRALGPIISGYTDAMSVRGATKEIPGFIAGATALLLVLAFVNGRPTVGSLLLTAVYAVPLFTAFKGGFVRHDGHATGAAGFLLAACLLAVIVRARVVTLALAALVVGYWGFVESHYAPMSAERLWRHALARVDEAAQGVARRSGIGTPLPQTYRTALAASHNGDGLPRVEGDADIYFTDITALLAAGNRWKPRPVLQSYSAYTPALAERNRAHLAAPTGPRHVFVRIDPIDGRLPGSEDGASWPVLMSAFGLARVGDDYVQLERGGPPAVGAPRLLESRTATLGERIPVPQTDGAVFARLDLNLSLRGRLANLLFKPPALVIEVERSDGATRHFRLVACSAAAGMLLSPLVEDAEDFALLWSDTALQADRQVAAIKVTVDGWAQTWRDRFDVTFESLPRPSDRPPAPAVMTRLVKPQPAPSGLAAEGLVRERTDCSANLDTFNGGPAFSNPSVRSTLKVRGWAVDAPEAGRLPDEVVLRITDGQGRQFVAPMRPARRPDVAAHLRSDKLDKAGFQGTLDLTGLKGPLAVAVTYRVGDAFTRCAGLSALVNLQGQRQP